MNRAARQSGQGSSAAVLLLLLLALATGAAEAMVPRWTPTYNMSLSTAMMPCNMSGPIAPKHTTGWGIASIDWNSAKRLWANARPMNCEELLVKQAKMTRAASPDTRVFVYRNLVKALPWFTSVREKIVDPAYAGWFIQFKPGGFFPNGTYHVPTCREGKCSGLYHDQEQTPQLFNVTVETCGNWTTYINLNDVSGMSPKLPGITDGGPQPDPQHCQAACDAHSNCSIYTWWRNSSDTVGTCWFTDQFFRNGEYPQPNYQPGSVTGFKGANPPSAASAAQDDQCVGECDCGDGLPCGEYLWDHRNGSMLRDFLINNFIGGPNGIANPDISGFFFDDYWTDGPEPRPPWAPPSYERCSMSETGGATEEDFFCSADAGLTKADTKLMKAEFDKTMAAAEEYVHTHGGFVWQQFVSRTASLDLQDPRPICADYTRSACAQPPNDTSMLLFEFTRKAYRSPLPPPFVEQDVAQFLLTRGAYAYIGYSWLGCVSEIPRPPQLDVDYGEPLEPTCRETAPNSGVFTRKWSKAEVTLDCNTWTANITMTS